jgi:hypothetical protein
VGALGQLFVLHLLMNQLAMVTDVLGIIQIVTLLMRNRNRLVKLIVDVLGLVAIVTLLTLLIKQLVKLDILGVLGMVVVAFVMEHTTKHQPVLDNMIPLVLAILVLETCVMAIIIQEIVRVHMELGVRGQRLVVI